MSRWVTISDLGPRPGPQPSLGVSGREGTHHARRGTGILPPATGVQSGDREEVKGWDDVSKRRKVGAPPMPPPGGQGVTVAPVPSV